ncbi:MAG: hypothetical protein IT210_07980 [Armatimonadetes bacterium]|nr:hypothetical protein [Armatimonadota bacterium]
MARRNRPALSPPRDPGQRHPFCLVLEHLGNSDNIGRLMRSADACLAAEVIVVGRRRFPSMMAVGSHRHLPYRHFSTAPEALAYLRRQGYAPVAIEQAPDSQDAFDAIYPSRPAFILGNEGSGVSSPFLEAAFLSVHLSMHGWVPSLNVGVAGAVVMYDFLRKERDRLRRAVVEIISGHPALSLRQTR